MTNASAYRAVCFALAMLLVVPAFLLARRSRTLPAELRARDRLFQMRGRLPVRPDFLLVAGDDHSIETMGQPLWPRRTHADVVRAVHRGRPRTIVLDHHFEERDRKQPGSDADLAKALAEARKVFLPLLHGTPGARPISPDDLRGMVALEISTVSHEFTRLRTTPDYAWLGFDPPVTELAVAARGMGVSTTEETADVDGVIRRTRAGWVSPIQYPAQPPPSEPSRLAGRTGVIPGLPVMAALFTFNLGKAALTYRFGEHLLIAGSLKPPVIIPLDAAGHMAINYVGPAGSMPRVSLADVARGRVEPAVFKNKVVFIGMTAGPAEETETLPTPVGPMPRVEITANAAHSILERNYLSVETTRTPLGALLALAALLGFFLLRCRPGPAALVTLLLLVLYGAAAVLVLRYWHVLLPVLPALGLGVVFYLAAVALRRVFGGRRGTQPV